MRRVMKRRKRARELEIISFLRVEKHEARR
jgi:hypothetical protein